MIFILESFIIKHFLYLKDLEGEVAIESCSHEGQPLLTLETPQQSAEYPESEDDAEVFVHGRKDIMEEPLIP